MSPSFADTGALAARAAINPHTAITISLGFIDPLLSLG
jgi:hypothetical protein